MANIVLDFLHNYQTGERRESEPANAYQYDEGHVLEAVLPEVITACEIHYWIRGMEEAEAYTPTSITHNEDDSCTVLGNIPNKYFEANGELRIYIVVTDGTASITTYEGKLHICQRSKPDDYVDDDPDNEAISYVQQAKAYSEDAEAWSKGTKSGTEVAPESDQYQNNSKHFAQQAAVSAEQAGISADGAITAKTAAEDAAAAAAAIVTVATDGTVIVDGDTKYVVTQKVEGEHLVTTLTAAS